MPRFSGGVEEEIHEYVQAAADLRAQFQAGVTAATRDLFESAGLPELIDLRWHDQPRDTGFVGHEAHADHSSRHEPGTANGANHCKARIGPASDSRRYLRRRPTQPRQQVHQN